MPCCAAARLRNVRSNVRAPAQQRHRSVLGGGRDRCTGGDEGIEYVRHLSPQRFDNRTAECVCVVELHDALALPHDHSVRRRRTRVPVDHDNLAAAARECDRGE